MRSRKSWLLLIVLLTGTLVWSVFFWQPGPAGNSALPQPAAAMPAGGDFILRGPDGTVSLADQRGRVVVLYFGYTFCPDVCPTALIGVAHALSSLQPEELAQVRAYFVSVDPERDTPEILRTYAPFFHPAIAGLGGTPDEVAKVAAQYGVRYLKQPPVDGAPYTVDHNSFTYVIGPDGKLAETLPHGFPPAVLAETLRRLLPGAKPLSPSASAVSEAGCSGPI